MLRVGKTKKQGKVHILFVFFVFSGEPTIVELALPERCEEGIPVDLIRRYTGGIEGEGKWGWYRSPRKPPQNVNLATLQRVAHTRSLKIPLFPCFMGPITELNCSEILVFFTTFSSEFTFLSLQFIYPNSRRCWELSCHPVDSRKTRWKSWLSQNCYFSQSSGSRSLNLPPISPCFP